MRVAVHLNMLAIGGTETFPKVFSAALWRLAQNPISAPRARATRR
jgi:hypothetical protein